LAFSCVAPGVDETPQPAEHPRALVARLARAKAAAVAVNHPEAWVIGSDQVAVRKDDETAGTTESAGTAGTTGTTGTTGTKGTTGTSETTTASKAVILGKPGTEARCIEQLRSSSGRILEFLTAVTLMQHDSGRILEFTDTTRVRFRELDPQTIERYVTREKPLDCAGGFKSEGLGITLCDSIDSADPTALIGLPLIQLSAALRSAGFELP
jgi:septum formation protein